MFGRGHVVCRATEREARERWRWVHVEHADVEAARRFARLSEQHSRSQDYSPQEQQLLEGVVAGRWALPLCGTADQIVERIAELHGAGLDGIVALLGRLRRGARADGGADPAADGRGRAARGVTAGISGQGWRFEAEVELAPFLPASRTAAPVSLIAVA